MKLRSPQMLLLSGVGPAKTLDSLNIPAVATREGVGQNLWVAIEILFNLG